MKYVILVLLFMSELTALGNSPLVLMGEKNFKYQQKHEIYKWRIDTEATSHKQLVLTVVSFKTKKTIVEKKYKLDREIFCASEPGEVDECTGTGVELVYLLSYPHPVAVLKAIIGAHSQTLKIYDPHKNSSEPVAEYNGVYSVAYEVGKEQLTITYDDYCSDIDPCDKRAHWPKVSK